MSWRNTFKFGFTLVILLYFKISQRMRQHWQSFPALITPFPANIFLKKIACTVPNSIPKNSLLCSFVSYSIVWVIHFIKRSNSLRDSTVLKMSFISVFGMISVVVAPDPNIFYEFLNRLLMLLILMVSEHFLPMVWAHSSLVTSQLSLMVQGVYQGIHLTVLSWIVESWMILYSQKTCKNLRLVYQSMINYMEN